MSYENNEDNSPSLETSILFQPRAIWVILALLMIALWYRFIPLAVVSIFLSLLFMIITIWKKVSLMNIKPSLQPSKSRLFTDEEFQIHASLYNGKWLPLVWLEWSFSKYKGISYGDSESGAYTVRFLWLLWFQKIEWTLNGKALRRGVYDIGQVILRSGDAFRFAEIEKLYGLDKKVYVYPKLISVNVPVLRPSMQWGVKGKQGGFLEDPLLVVGIREYQAGDEMRRFNWRASARTGKLQTNVYQPVIVEQLIIYVDVQGFVIDQTAYEDPIELKTYVYDKSESFEGFLSVIASVAVKYSEKGISIGFASNGLTSNREPMLTIPPDMNLTPLLDQLAQITQSVGVHKMSALDEMLHKGMHYTPIFIFCHDITKDHYMWYQQNRHKLSDIFFYYKIETEYSKKLGSIAKPMEAFPFV